MSWTQPICDDCFARMFPGVMPHRVTPEYRDDETCCMCGIKIRNGLYARLDPTTVRYPTVDAPS